MVNEAQKLLFLDRDGTIIVDKNYMHDPNEIEFLNGAIDALQSFISDGFKLYVITNQSGIGRGFFQEEDMHAVHQKMNELLAKEQIKIEDYLFCPHAPEDNCDCRKPSPKLINEVLNKYQNVDLLNSYMIGDKVSDVEAGENAGIKGILLTERGENSFKSLWDFYLSL